MQYHQTPPGATAQPAAKSVRFRLYAVTAVVVIVTAAFSSVMAAIFYPERPGGVSGHVGAVAIFTLLIALVGWVVYRVARRSSLAGNITVITLAVLLFGLAPFGVMIHHARERNNEADARNEAAVERHDREYNDQLRSLQARAAQGEPIDFDIAKFDLTCDYFRGTANDTTGPISHYFDALAAEFEGVRDRFVRYSAEWTELGDRGQLASWARSPDDLKQTIDQVQNLRIINKEIQDVFVHIEQSVERRVVQAGVDVKTAGVLAAGFRRGYDLRAVLRSRRMEDKAAEGYIEMLQVLLDEWGAWEWDAEQEMTLFESDEAIERFNAAVQKIQDAAAEQQKL